MTMAEEWDRQTAQQGAPTEATTLGQVNKEGHFAWSPTRSPADEEVLAFFSMPEVSSAVEGLRRMRGETEKFYEKLGVNPLLPTYGQIGAHEAAVEGLVVGAHV